MLHRIVIVVFGVCLSGPVWAICGDGVLDEGEACDDGNVDASDGCSDGCAVEAGYVCRMPGQLCDALVCEADMLDGGGGVMSAAVRTNYLEFGVGPGGYFGTEVDVPLGYHPRPEYEATWRELGMVADPFATGWTSWLEVDAVCIDTCDSDGDDDVCEDGGLGSTASTCQWGSDCSDCGTRYVGGICEVSCDPLGEADGVCEDGGPGSTASTCALGTDCADCGTRVPGVLCDDTCDTEGDLDEICEDGGQGSTASTCALGTDCSDCGDRYDENLLTPRPHYNGDYFVPGSPEEGWGLVLGAPLCDDTCDSDGDDDVCEDGGFDSASSGCTYGTDCGDCGVRIDTPTTYNNNRDSPVNVTGEVTGAMCFSEVVCGLSGGAEITWAGATSEGLEVAQVARVLDGNTFVMVDVTLTNTSDAELAVMYMRNIDPDNNEPVTGDYTTRNEVLNQGGDDDGILQVEARQWDGDNGTTTDDGTAIGAEYWPPFTNSKISLVGAGDNARVTYGGFANRSPEAIFWSANTADEFVQEVGVSNFDDIALSLVYFFESIPAGESVELRFAYSLEEDASIAVDCATDVDECELGTDDCDVDHGVCTNLPGSYECSCEDGYEGDGVTCTNVDECTAGTDDCDENATCEDADGSFTCTCNDGYTGDGATCADVDECSEGTDTCDPATSVCTNTDGSYECNCAGGYESDGADGCVDIDECVAGTDSCADDEECTNTAGSFECDPGEDAGGCDCSTTGGRPDAGMLGLLAMAALAVLRRRRRS